MSDTIPTNTQFAQDVMKMALDEVMKRERLTFEEVFNLMYPVEYPKNLSFRQLWGDLVLTAVTTESYKTNDRGVEIEVPAGTRVRIWMVSRMGDCGVTNNLINPIGYHHRGVEAESLKDWEITRKRVSDYTDRWK